jgi:hypothetical protein
LATRGDTVELSDELATRFDVMGATTAGELEVPGPEQVAPVPLDLLGSMPLIGPIDQASVAAKSRAAVLTAPVAVAEPEDITDVTNAVVPDDSAVAEAPVSFGETSEPDTGEPEIEQPKQVEAKSLWLAWAAQCIRRTGGTPDMTELESQTKQELIKQYKAG